MIKIPDVMVIHKTCDDLVLNREDYNTGQIVLDVSERFDIGNTFKKHRYQKNHMLENLYYRYLLAFCEIYKPNHVLELGTQVGSGAAALSIFSGRVTTADVNTTEVSKKVWDALNIEVKTLKKPDDCLDFDFNEYDLVFVDIDHNGYLEAKLNDIFIEEKFQGVVFWDDIRLNSNMEKFWNNINLLNVIGRTETNWHSECGFGITKYV